MKLGFTIKNKAFCVLCEWEAEEAAVELLQREMIEHLMGMHQRQPLLISIVDKGTRKGEEQPRYDFVGPSWSNGSNGW